MEGTLSSNIVFLRDLYNVSDDEMPQTGLLSHDAFLEPDQPDCYKMSAMEEDLLDQFDDDSIIELELRGKGNQDIPQW